MKKYLLFPLCAALCLLAGCADDFPTELNHNYYQDDTRPPSPTSRSRRSSSALTTSGSRTRVRATMSGRIAATSSRSRSSTTTGTSSGFQEANSTIRANCRRWWRARAAPRMVVRRPRFAGRQERRGAGHRLRSRPVRTERPALFLALADARRDELRLGRGELPPHRLLRRGDGTRLTASSFS